MAADAALAAVPEAAAAAGLDAARRARAELDWDAALPARATGWRWRAGQAIKRTIDVVVSAVLLVLLLPVFLMLAVLVKATSPGPVLFEWKVLGRRARPFTGYKFRTMVDGADTLRPAMRAHNEMSGPVFKMRRDPRVTRVGRWLRRYSLDELPQLWSVLIGDMSLVGPRPVYPEEFGGFERWQWAKLAVVPGITCLWQVRGRAEISNFDEWVGMDLDYIERWTLGLDLEILMRTLPAVLSGRGAY